jgi:hypothetical protein
MRLIPIQHRSLESIQLTRRGGIRGRPYVGCVVVQKRENLRFGRFTADRLFGSFARCQLEIFEAWSLGYAIYAART